MAGLFTILAALFGAQGADGSASLTPPETPAALQPTSPWQIDYGDERCMALRRFGYGRAEITLIVQRDASDELISIGIAGRSLQAQPERPEISVEIGENDAAGHSVGRAVQLADNRRMVAVEYPLAGIGVRLRNARTLRFAPARGEAHFLRLNGMGAVLDRLNHCHQTLLESWGVDVSAFRALRSPPEPIDAEDWISRYQVPGFAGQADGAVILTISAEGRVTACRTVDTSGLRAVDENICRQMIARARFRPAIGPDGAPVSTQLVQRVRYQTPR